MPCLRVQVSVPLGEEKKKAVLSTLSRIVSGALGKPEQYVMVVIGQSAIMMSGTDMPSAFVDMRSIGKLNQKTNTQLTREICAVLNENMGIAAERVFLNFTDVSAANWGWNNQTFG
ncbi:MAG: phenylpyruvate tautomerase MIF-related protein [Candidatus Omnitrophica bacterium]|jgi:Macrophage migration inhibitory factor (MIF).|nr:phenylpyruvate tautomerase MIF-related protein [Candidatus Omnitrophota bacterium]